MISKNLFFLLPFLFPVVVKAADSKLQTEQIIDPTIVTGDFNWDGLKDIACVSQAGSDGPRHLLIFFQKSPGTFYLALDARIFESRNGGIVGGSSLDLSVENGILKIEQDSGDRFIDIVKQTLVYTKNGFKIWKHSYTVDKSDKTHAVTNDKKSASLLPLLSPNGAIRQSPRFMQLTREITMKSARK
jgi:hypothetical protein